MSAAALAETLQLLDATGMNSGTAGNLSVRVDGGLLVTPSAVPPQHVTADRIVQLDMDGSVLSAGVPTSEWRIHRDIYAARPDAGAIVHMHSVHATALATLREDLPPFHYQVAKAGGHSIRCSDYAPYGTQELSDAVLAALGTNTACLMANHGMVAFAGDLEAALSLAIEVETLCHQYLVARSAGTPVLLTTEQMDVIQERFKGYGKPEA